MLNQPIFHRWKKYLTLNNMLTKAVGYLLLACSTMTNALGQSDISSDVGKNNSGTMLTPVNQLLTPFGQQVELPGLRPQAIALSHDGKLLAVSGKTNQLLIVDPKTGTVTQRVNMPGNKSAEEPAVDRSAQVSYTGLIFSRDDSKIFLSDVNGSIKEFSVDQRQKVKPLRSIQLPPAGAPRRKAEIPSGLSLSDDQQTLYVCANLSNQLLAVDLASSQVTKKWPVGVAPYEVRVVDNVAIVSNWGGRRPDEDSVTGPAGKGTVVRVDPELHVASEGSVTLIDLNKDEPSVELVVGRHASGLAVSPDKQFVLCTNAADDFISVINLHTKTLERSIWAKPNPADLFGASPNAIEFGPDGKRIYVANGSQNAIAVIEWEPEELEDCKLLGLIPVGWYPGALAISADARRLFVGNIKGFPQTPRKAPQTNAMGFNSHQYTGSLSIFELPTDDKLESLSAQASRNMRTQRIRESLLAPRQGVAAKAIPSRIGEPSLIKHVVYIIKENRTYDQVLGDIKAGRGRKDLCIFGRKITPNQHKMVDQFVLLDNTYCAGILSADGHQWSTSAISTDYMEKSFAGFPRSYPDGMEDNDVDALAYSPKGFIWDNAKSHGVTIRNYGEFMIPRVRYRDDKRTGSPDFLSCYRTWKGESKEVIFACEPGIETVADISPTDYVGWNMSVPDQYRADFVIDELKNFEQQGSYPQLTIICLPNDHASGTKPGCPTPAACVADNDLAFGRIVEALSHSKFWPEMAIFCIEDDPQAGWDHISGYRTTAYVVSPYARRKQVINTHYNTTSILRTIEQILGLPPMNQFDASAEPMFDCFTDKPNYASFDSLPSNIPLDQMNPSPDAILDPQLRSDAIVSKTLNFEQVDRAPEDVLNRILWRAMKGSTIPYPAWACGIDEDDD